MVIKCNRVRSRIFTGRHKWPARKFLEHEHSTVQSLYNALSYDITSGKEITPCNKIDGLQIFGKYDIHNNIAYIMTRL